jgi:heme-degrading monooxygenase HmoA
VTSANSAVKVFFEALERQKHKVPIKPSSRSHIETKAGFVVVWEFRIRTAKRRAFERAYGPDGEWATFFRKGKGYLGTELIRDELNPGRYLTLDFWKSQKHYERFKSQNRKKYEVIDESYEALTIRESEIGQFSRPLRRS